ncbi:hypothetical protein HMPREF1316_2520, partial [Olsenella profusa F0195]
MGGRAERVGGAMVANLDRGTPPLGSVVALGRGSVPLMTHGRLRRRGKVTNRQHVESVVPAPTDRYAIISIVDGGSCRPRAHRPVAAGEGMPWTRRQRHAAPPSGAAPSPAGASCSAPPRPRSPWRAAAGGRTRTGPGRWSQGTPPGSGATWTPRAGGPSHRAGGARAGSRTAPPSSPGWATISWTGTWASLTRRGGWRSSPCAPTTSAGRAGGCSSAAGWCPWRTAAGATWTVMAPSSATATAATTGGSTTRGPSTPRTPSWAVPTPWRPPTGTAGASSGRTAGGCCGRRTKAAACKGPGPTPARRCCPPAAAPRWTPATSCGATSPRTAPGRSSPPSPPPVPSSGCSP